MRKRLLITYLFLLTSTLCTFSQDLDYSKIPVYDYSNVREYEIADVTVSGVEFLQPVVLISISGFKVGNTITVPGDEITRAIEKFWAQGLFADVKITASRIEGNKYVLDAYEGFRNHLSVHGIDLSAVPPALGPELLFDSEKEKFHGEQNDLANLFLKDTYREPFVIREEA